MKHLKTRILSAILSATVITSALPLTAGAYTSLDYNIALVDESFDGDTAVDSIFTNKPSEWFTNAVVSAADNGLADGDNHGDVVEISKRETTQDEVGYNDDGSVKNPDNYFRILYNEGKNIDKQFQNNPHMLKNARVTFDVYMEDITEDVNVRFYDNITGSSTKGSNLIRIDSDGYFKFLNGDGMDYEKNTWYSFEVYLDFDSDTYTAYVNGELKADKLGFSAITDCITSFGLQMGGTTHQAYKLYMDNISYYIPEVNLLPSSTNTVWENDFDFVEATDGVLPSGSYDSKNEELSEIDYRPENCDFSIIKEADGNQYLRFVPNNSSKVANVGNRMDGYFTTKGTDTRESAGYEAGTNTYDLYPYPIDKFRIDKLRLDMSLMLDSYMNTSVRTYYKGTMNGTHNAAISLLSFSSDGKMTISSESTKIAAIDAGTYEPETWYDITLWVDYTNHTIVCYIDGEYRGTAAMSSVYEYFNQIRIRTSPSDNKDVTDISTLGVSVDNIRYSTTYSEDYINRNAYNYEMARIDFDEMEAGAVLDEANTDYCFLKPDATEISVVYDEDKGHNVAFVNDGGSYTAGYFGMGAAKVQSSYSYSNYGKYPDAVKVEVELKRTGSDAAYIRMNDKEILLVSGSGGELKFSDSGSRVSSGVTTNIGDWLKITMYMDFAAGTYTAYADDALIGEYGIPSEITTPEIITVCGNKLAHVWLDNITVATLPPYAENKIVEYFDADGNFKLGYVMNNTSEKAMTYGVYCAKYAYDGTLEDITLATDTVTASAMELKTLEKLEATDGGYYTYFVWEDLVSLKPLFECKTVR